MNSDAQLPARESIAPRDAHKLAWDRFQRAFTIHTAAVNGFQLLRVMPDMQQQFEPLYLGLKGFDPNIDRDSLRMEIGDLFDAIEGEAAGGFQVMRSSALVSICGAFEFILKANFVAYALADVEGASARLRARGQPVRIDAQEFLGLPPAEQWHRIADEIYKRTGEGGKPMAARVATFLLECTPMHDAELAQRKGELDSILDEDGIRLFNRAFLYRNCLVHNGARLSRELARAVGLTPGDSVSLTAEGVRRMTRTIRRVAELASPYWALGLG